MVFRCFKVPRNVCFHLLSALYSVMDCFLLINIQYNQLLRSLYCNAGYSYVKNEMSLIVLMF